MDQNQRMPVPNDVERNHIVFTSLFDPEALYKSNFKSFIMTHLLKHLERENRNKSEENLVKVLYMEEEYVKGIIHQYMPNLKIDLVEKVNNNFLEGMYQLTKAEYVSRYGSCEEKNIFHVTAASNVCSIIKDNLNWRKCRRSSYGKGNYFSEDAHLANRICNEKAGYERAMIICKILVGRSTVCGCTSTYMLPNGIDTGTAYNGQVYVKFGDNEFLPIFVAFYKRT